MIDSVNLSEHFTKAEMTRTQHRGFAEANRKIPANLYDAGIALCTTLLEPIRMAYNYPLVIHSGYRMPALNAAIHGSKTSQHMAFEAADFHVSGYTLDSVFEWIWHESGLRWGQLMLEGFGGHYSWIHMSLGKPWRSANCQQVLKMMNGKYTWLSEGQ